MRITTGCVKTELPEHPIDWVAECTEKFVAHAVDWQRNFDAWPVRRSDGMPYEPRHAPWMWQTFEKLFGG